MRAFVAARFRQSSAPSFVEKLSLRRSRGETHMNDAPKTVDEYISGFAPDVRRLLESVRAAVRDAVPDGEERISYRMPAVFCKGVVVYFAAFKNHLGVFPPVEEPSLRERVARFAGPKGNLQFPYSEPLPLEIIAAVARARARCKSGQICPQQGEAQRNPRAARHARCLTARSTGAPTASRQARPVARYILNSPGRASFRRRLLTRASASVPTFGVPSGGVLVSPRRPDGHFVLLEEH